MFRLPSQAMPPFEIVDHIFSFLSWDWNSLRQCSMADPFLASIAGPYLFRFTGIMVGSKIKTGPLLPYTCLEITELLSGNPLIATYVQLLEIQIRGPTGEIIALLPFFSGLKTLVVTWLTGWDCMSTDFITALDCCMRLPSLTEVHFDTMLAMPFDFLDKWKNIKSLTFCAINYLIAGLHSEPVPDTPNLQLESLSIEFDNRSMYHISGAINHIHNLRSLTLRDPFHEVLLETCSTTLTSLCLDFRAHCMFLHFPDIQCH